MKKILLTTFTVLLLGTLVWIFFFRGTSAPIIDTLRDGLPFGSGEGVDLPISNNSDSTIGEKTNFDINANEQKIFRIANTPTAGFVAFTRGTSTIVRYMDRATGHISETNLKTSGVAKITNQTIPKIYEAYFKKDGGAVVIRTIEGTDQISNSVITLTPPKNITNDALYTITSTKLRGDMDSLLVGSGDTLSYVLRDVPSIVSSTFTGTGLKTLISSPIKNWRLFKLGNNTAIYTKATASVSGYAYSLTGSSLNKILGPLNGLTVIGNSLGDMALYSYTDTVGTKLAVKNIKTGDSSDILPVSLAEKCVWSTKKPYIFYCGTPTEGVSAYEPDNWYLGKTHFTDNLWHFDMQAELAQLVMEPDVEFGLDLDISDPQLSPNEDYLIFINKRDLTLWAVKL